jgi:hypothetical protein
MLSASSDKTPLRRNERVASLNSILEADGLPYADEAELLLEFRKMFGGGSSTGSSISRA